MSAEKLEAVYLVDRQFFFHLKETESGFQYEAFHRSDKKENYSGMLTWEDLLESRIASPLAAARVAACDMTLTPSAGEVQAGQTFSTRLCFTARNNADNTFDLAWRFISGEAEVSVSGGLPDPPGVFYYGLAGNEIDEYFDIAVTSDREGPVELEFYSTDRYGQGFARRVTVNFLAADRIDGCTDGRALWNIYIPMSRPVFLTSAVLTGFYAWNEFTFALVFVKKDALKTIPVGLLAFQGEMHAEWAVLLAGLTISAIPIILFYIFSQIYFIAGLCSGGVKG